MVKEIPLTRGKIALVSDEDYDRVKDIKWYAERKVSCSGRERFYARGTDPTRRKKLEYLHLVIMGDTGGFQVDHIDGDGLNCTRENMRLSTHGENNFNKGIQHNNTSGYKGVTRNKDGKKCWRARIVANKQRHTLVYTNDIEFAARVYDVAALYVHGAFARFNFETFDEAAIAHVDAWFIRNGKEGLIP
jgi:transcriptional antiterminator Rof (Rho-off)